MRLINLLLTTTTCLFMFVLFTATNTYAKKKKKSEMYLVLDIDGEINYKATFDSLTEKGCHTCIKAGFGWSDPLSQSDLLAVGNRLHVEQLEFGIERNKLLLVRGL